MNNQFNDELGEEFDDTALLAFIEHLLSNRPGQMVSVLNVPRYKEDMRSINTVIDAVRRYYPEADCSIHFDPLIGTSLVLRITNCVITFDNVLQLCDALSVASAVEMLATTDGDTILSITYDNVKQII